MKKSVVVFASVLVLVALLWLGFRWLQGPQTAAPSLSPAQVAALQRPHAPSVGAPSAKVTLVEFFDPACGTCAQFYPLVKDMVRQSDGKLRLVLRYAPFHKGSHEVVLALEAARLQGRYWPAVEALMGAQGDWVNNHTVQIDRVWPLLAAQGVDLAKARADMQNPQLQGQVEQDLLDGKDLEVFKTPSFFVNGQALTEFGLEPLQDLVRAHIQRAYTQ